MIYILLIQVVSVYGYHSPFGTLLSFSFSIYGRHSPPFENIAQDDHRIKGFFIVIRSVYGTIDDEDVVSKMLRTSIHELRTFDRVPIDGLGCKITNFELSNYDNSVLNVESSCKASLSLVIGKKCKDTSGCRELDSMFVDEEK